MFKIPTIKPKSKPERGGGHQLIKANAGVRLLTELSSQVHLACVCTLFVWTFDTPAFLRLAIGDLH